MTRALRSPRRAAAVFALVVLLVAFVPSGVLGQADDGAFEGITKKDVRDDMLIPLEHGQPIRFGADKERGVVLTGQGQARIVDVADVGEEAILVHDEHREEPGLAFMLSRLAKGPHEPTPIGVFRDVDHLDYGTATQRQLVEAQERQGPGDLGALLGSLGTWEV